MTYHLRAQAAAELRRLRPANRALAEAVGRVRREAEASAARAAAFELELAEARAEAQVREYNIIATPYGRDVREAACPEATDPHRGAGAWPGHRSNEHAPHTTIM
jgi:hypothetical protein